MNYLWGRWFRKKRERVFRMKLCNTEYITLEDDKVMKVEYYLTERNSCENEKTIYGIKLIKTQEDRTEEEMVDDLSYDETVVLDLLNLLSKNQVTPVGLVPVLDDYITERICG